VEAICSAQAGKDVHAGYDDLAPGPAFGEIGYDRVERVLLLVLVEQHKVVEHRHQHGDRGARYFLVPQEYSIATDRLAATMLGARLAALELAAFRFSRRPPPVVVCQI
jgi:hypothetical protein